MTKIIETRLPDIDVYCPKCDEEICVNSAEFEHNNPKYYAVANVYCEECDHYFTTGLVN